MFNRWNSNNYARLIFHFCDIENSFQSKKVQYLQFKVKITSIKLTLIWNYPTCYKIVSHMPIQRQRRIPNRSINHPLGKFVTPVMTVARV